MRDLKAYWDAWPHATAEEAKAEEIVRTCAREEGDREIPIPVPIERWMEGPLHLNFEVRDLSELQEGLNGPEVIGIASCSDPPSIVVSKEIEYQDGRFRFTCAHELGHIVLHRDVAVRFEEDDRTMHQLDRGLEAKANRFASRFLMPWQALQSELLRILHDCEVDQQAYVEILLSTNEKSVWLWKHRVLPRITQRFGVSLSAAIYRFNSIRLPGRRRFLSKDIVQDLLSSEMSIGRSLRRIV